MPLKQSSRGILDVFFRILFFMNCLSDFETMKTNSPNLGDRNYQLTLSRRKIALVQQQLVWKWYESDLVASIRILVRWRYRPLIGKINRQSIHGPKWEILWRAFPSLVLKIEQHRQQGWDTGLMSIFADVVMITSGWGGVMVKAKEIREG